MVMVFSCITLKTLHTNGALATKKGMKKHLLLADAFGMQGQ
jgi:hypothetical protein